jgi:hypothetical protein
VKRFLSFQPLFLLAACWATLAGCSLPSISPAERAYSLVAGVNAVSRDVLADGFLPTIADLAKLQDPAQYPAFWETNFPYSNGPYSLTLLNAADPAAVSLTLLDNKGGAPLDILLTMGRIGNDWFIQRMEMPPLTVIVQ